jgi:hypothetical protein
MQLCVKLNKFNVSTMRYERHANTPLLFLFFMAKFHYKKTNSHGIWISFNSLGFLSTLELSTNLNKPKTKTPNLARTKHEIRKNK